MGYNAVPWVHDSPSEGRNQRSTRASEEDVSSSESCAGLKRACHTQCEWAACSARGRAVFLLAPEEYEILLWAVSRQSILAIAIR